MMPFLSFGLLCATGRRVRDQLIQWRSSLRPYPIALDCTPLVVARTAPVIHFRV